MNYRYIKSPSEAEELAKKLMTRKVIGFDTETTGLDPHTDKVILASFTDHEGTYLVDTRDVNCLTPFKPVLENEEIAKLGVNLVFDYTMTKGTAGIDIEGSRDLMLAEYCLEAGVQWEGFGLEAITKKYLGKERDKSLQKSFVGHKGDFSDAQLQYAAEDTADLFPLGKTMQEKLQQAGVMSAWGIENRAITSFGDIQFYGQRIDQDAWRGIMEWNKEKMGFAKLELDGFYKPFFDADLFGEVHINYNSQPTILYGLQKMGIQVDNELIEATNKEVQKKILHLPVIMSLQKYREAVKAYGTYGQSYLDAIHEKTGRIHPRFNQYGTETGRPSCRGGLNVLNIPRDKRFRNAFVTDPDRQISTVDFSGAELRILADQSGDPLMVEGFNSGTDFHCYIASMLFGVEVTKKNENAKLRQPAKTINFG